MVAAPRFSVLTPVHDPPAHVLEEAIESVRSQTFADWQLVLVDDGSRPAIGRLLDAAAAHDPRIVVHHRPSNGGIVAASNDALDRATGEFVALLDHDDRLDRRALELVDEAARRWSDLDYCYSDEDLLVDGRGPTFPFYKPDWSPERLRSQNYCSHLSVLRRSLAIEVGGFRAGFDGSQDHDLVLRVTERARRIVHVPHVLYHWRVSSTSVARDRTAKPYAYEAGRRAVEDHCGRVGIDADVEPGATLGTYVVRRRVPAPPPLVSVVIPTAGAHGRVWGIERCYVVEAVRSVCEHTTRELEFVIVADRDTPTAAVDGVHDAAGDRRVTFVPFDRPFNFSEKVNLGSVHASGELLLLLNDDVEVITDEFLDAMIPLALETDVGAVGAKMYFADGRLQHAGHVYNHNPRHAMFGWPGDSRGVGDLLLVTRECAGVTAACLLTRAHVFDEVGGFSPRFPANFNDVDFSLKLDRAGYRRIWTPHAELYHFESATRSIGGGHRATADEDAELRRRWEQQLLVDRYYNPNLAPDRDDWVERGLR